MYVDDLIKVDKFRKMFMFMGKHMVGGIVFLQTHFLVGIVFPRQQ